ncbi:MAG: hypothetical protein ACI9EF_001264 [Pseudohongiellaceae bacterium]|jgi:hypothetical protein
MTQGGLAAGALDITSRTAADGNTSFVLRSPSETLLDAAVLLKFLVQLEGLGSHLSVSQLHLEWSPSAETGLTVWAVEIELTQQTSVLPNRELSALVAWAHLGRTVLSEPDAAEGLQFTSIDIQAQDGQATMTLAGALAAHTDLAELTGALRSTGTMNVVEGWLHDRQDASLLGTPPLTFDQLEVSYTPQARGLKTPTHATR